MDGRTDRRTDTEGYNIIPRHTLVAGYKNDMLIPFNKFHFNCVEKEIIFLHEIIISFFYQLTSLDNITVTFISLRHISSKAFWGKRDIF